MNWPEHLRVLHRLTGAEEFELMDEECNLFRLNLTCTNNSWVMCYEFDDETQIFTDEQLQVYLSTPPGIEITQVFSQTVLTWDYSKFAHLTLSSTTR